MEGNNGLHSGAAVVELRSRCNGKAVDLTPFANLCQHSSLRAVGTTGAKRNVLKRFERVALLKKRGQWKDGDRVTGLRKTKPEA